MTIDGPLMAQLRDIPMSSKSLVRLLDVLASHQPVHPELEALTQRRANDRLRKQRSRDRHVTVTVQSRDGHVTTAPPSSPSPSPLPPEPPSPAPTPPPAPPPARIARKAAASADQSAKLQAWRAFNQDRANEANAVLLPPVPSEFADCWAEWCEYRTSRAVQARVASEAVQWTAQAAEMTIRGALSAAEVHGWSAVVERFREAISRNWRGPNLTEMRLPPKGAPRAPTQQAKPSDTTNRSSIKI